MSLRERRGNWHYRFWAAGRSWTADTGLAATERNRPEFINGIEIREVSTPEK